MWHSAGFAAFFLLTVFFRPLLCTTGVHLFGRVNIKGSLCKWYCSCNGVRYTLRELNVCKTTAGVQAT